MKENDDRISANSATEHSNAVAQIVLEDWDFNSGPVAMYLHPLVYATNDARTIEIKQK